MLEIWQNLVPEFCRKQNKRISILTEIHVNHDQIHHIRNNRLGPSFLCPRDIHTEGLLAVIYSSLEVVTEAETDPKRNVCVL